MTTWVAIKVDTRQEWSVEKRILLVADKKGCSNIIKDIDSVIIGKQKLTPTVKNTFVEPLLPGYILIKCAKEDYFKMYNFLMDIPGVQRILGCFNNEEYLAFRSNIEEYDHYLDLWNAEQLVNNNDTKKNLESIRGIEIHNVESSNSDRNGDISKKINEEISTIKEEIEDSGITNRKERDKEFIRKIKEKYEELISSKKNNRSCVLIRLPHKFIAKLFEKYGKYNIEPTHKGITEILAITAMPAY